MKKYHIYNKNNTLSLFLSYFFFFFLVTKLPQSNSHVVNKYSDCNYPFKCGELASIISYPFWTDGLGLWIRPRFCGGRDEFKLNCETRTPSITIDSLQFQVLDINITTYTMKMIAPGLPNHLCDSSLTNYTLNTTFFEYRQNLSNITLFYNCPHDISFINNFTKCPTSSEPVFYANDGEILRYPELLRCKNHTQIKALNPLKDDAGFDQLNKTLGGGFEVKYKFEDAEKCIACMASNGTCGRSANEQEYKFRCYCQDGSESSSKCSSKSTLNLGRKIGIGFGAAAFGALSVIIGVYIYQRRKKSRYTMSYVQSQSFTTSDPSSIVRDTEKGSQYFGAHVFTYDELEEATHNFDSARELGDGGFGTVYYGELHDGRRVAVKRLYENNYRRVEQFKNEVEILTRLRHPNLVSLFGCTSRHSRELLLVYEYIPNGTVADHLHGRKAKPDAVLPWHTRMNIAVDTASALKYLHASEIIHRDVKTNNILLDSHFCVKVADFGLSRLFPTHATHISTAPQGTPGYVDPEYHECYQLTSKSDVYSFGVVLIELISSLPAVDITRHRHEINLSTMAINKIHNQALHELVDPKLGFETDFKVRKMINAVAELAFRCLQSSKEMRPSMEEVLETLLDIQSDGDGKHKSQPEVLDISAGNDVVLIKDDPPPPSPDSNVVSKSTTPNASG